MSPRRTVTFGGPRGLPTGAALWQVSNGNTLGATNGVWRAQQLL
jgi:hypothetical protein